MKVKLSYSVSFWFPCIFLCLLTASPSKYRLSRHIGQADDGVDSDGMTA